MVFKFYLGHKPSSDSEGGQPILPRHLVGSRVELWWHGQRLWEQMVGFFYLIFFGSSIQQWFIFGPHNYFFFGFAFGVSEKAGMFFLYCSYAPLDWLARTPPTRRAIAGASAIMSAQPAVWSLDNLAHF